MATASVSHHVSHSASQTVPQSDRRAAGSIQELCEKFGFRVFEGYSEFEETWESPTVLVLSGRTEMEADNGLVLKASVSRIRIEFGEYSLDAANMKPTGKVA